LGPPSPEQTAAAEGPVGVLRRDPFAMLPFCGYNMADYFNHWLSFGDRIGAESLPKIFQVNWFRKGTDGSFLWPGFGENSRVIDWIISRLENRTEGQESPIGLLPKISELNLNGLTFKTGELEDLFDVDPESWLYEVRSIEQFFDRFGDKMPQKLRGELIELEARLLQEQGAMV
jgi:phosphoenolpyruvate carboxykinase (GTP)